MPDSPANIIPEEHILLVDAVRPEFSYARNLPNILAYRAVHQATARLKLADMLRDQVLCPTEIVYTLRDVNVLSGKYIVTGSGIRLAQSFHDADLSAASRERLATMAGSIPWSDRAADDRVVVQIAKEGAGNYGHTLTEILPKLVNLARVLKQTPVAILLPKEAASFRPMYELVGDLLGLDASFVSVEDGSLYHFSQLVWVAPVSRYPDQKSQALLELATLLHDAAPPDHPLGGEFLYLGRRPDEKRHPENWLELEQVVESLGYKSVAPGGLSLLDQAAIFRNAKVILGPMGAALTNSIFAPPSCHVAMIDPGLVDLFYWDLACLKGQEFSLTLVRPIEEWSVHTLLSNYPVDVGSVRALARNLKNMESEHQADVGTGAGLPTKASAAVPAAPLLSVVDDAGLTCLAPCFWGDIDQLNFLAEVRRLIAPFGERGAFAGDNMIVFGRNLSFLEDEKFLAAFRHYIVPENNVGYAIMWRLYTFCWSAKNGLPREGDFVECGVFSGTSSAIMCRYLDFANVDKKLYLFDVWEEDDRVETTKYPGFDSELFKAVKDRFSPFPNVELRKGFIPESFAGELPEKIAFLHIDLNNASAEIAALDVLFDRVVPGGIILFDDYGSSGYRASKIEEDRWMAERGYTIIELPTSQGLVIR